MFIVNEFRLNFTMRVVQTVVDLSENVKSVVVEQHAIRAFGWHVTRVGVNSERLTANGVDTPAAAQH